MQENLAGVRVVRAYSQEAHEIERFRAANEEYVRRNRVLIRLQGLFYPSMTFFLGLGALLVLWLGGQAVIRGRITLGEFFAFNSYLAMLSWPMIAFGWVTNILQRGMASWERMLEVIDAVPDDRRRARDRARTHAAGRGDDRDPRTSRSVYPGSRPPGAATTSRCTSPPAPTAAFVGGTGSGKCTLIALLPRLHEPPPGTVFLDGVDVREIPLATLRGAIGFVPQEPFLFSDSSRRTSPSRRMASSPPGSSERSGRSSTDRAGRRRRAARQGRRGVPERLRHGHRRARHHAVGRAEAAHRDRARPLSPIRRSWSSTMRCRRWTRIPRTRS